MQSGPTAGLGVTLAVIYDFLHVMATLHTLQVNDLPVHILEVLGSSPATASFFGFSPNDPVFGLGVSYHFLIIFTLLFSYFHVVWRCSLPIISSSCPMSPIFNESLQRLFRRQLHFSRLVFERVLESLSF